MLNGPRADTDAAALKSRYAFDWPGIAAFLLYLGLAFLFFARGLIGHFSTAYIGINGADPPQFMWLLAWWPHAIRHGLNPLYSRAIWAPHGVNLAWTTGMPLLSITLMPIVYELGPVVAYNIACLLAVALAGWCAFILCRYVTGAYWPSIVGGYVFGFSTYAVVHALLDINLLLVFPMPLIVLLLLRAMRSDITRFTLVSGLVAALAAQFFLFVELFVTMTIFIGIAFLILMAVGSSSDRKRALSLLPAVALSYFIMIVLVSPYLYFMLTAGYEVGAVHPALLYSTDFLNLVVPTLAQELGTIPLFKAISGHFLGVMIEATGYIGIPLLLVAAAFTRRWWHAGWGRVAALFFVVAVVLSLGPFLLVAGRIYTPLPGLLLAVTPLIDKALPARLMLYAFLALAVMTTIWLSTTRIAIWLRVIAALTIVLSILPNLSASFWTKKLDVPRFFSDHLYTKYLTRGETVVVLPYAINGQSMGWQLASHWYFRMAGGYVGNPPIEFRRWPAVRAFYRVDNFVLPDAGNQLRAFLAAHQAHAVLVDDREAAVWRPLMATLNVTPIRAGNMTLYRLPPSELAPWTKATALEMETRAAQVRFAALLDGAEALLRAGHSAASLTPGEILSAHALPEGWVVVPAKIQPPYAEGGLNLPRHAANPHRYAGMWLAANENGTIQIGIEGSYAALRQVLNKYRAYAMDFTPHNLAEAAKGAILDRRGMLIMSFNSDGLHQAAELTRSNPR